nr:two-component system, cell cycle response regulator DivK [Candidatus Cloacimonadota bacterium]
MDKLVLIIEDNSENYYLMRYLLENHGLRVIGAVSGWMGIEMAIYNKPDIILLDIQLPGMDGYSVTRRIRSNPEIKDIPIVAVTSYAMVGDKEHALAAGADGYIEKPINPDSFADEIIYYLNNKRRTDEDPMR